MSEDIKDVQNEETQIMTFLDENGNKVTETIVTHHDSAGKTAAQGTVGCLLVIVAIIVFFILFIISKA